MKDKYHKCLDICKDYNQDQSIKSLDNISADKLIYDYAIKMCRAGAIKEILDEREEVRISVFFYSYCNLFLNILEFQKLSNGPIVVA